MSGDDTSRERERKSNCGENHNNETKLFYFVKYVPSIIRISIRFRLHTYSTQRTFTLTWNRCINVDVFT
jgi:hypothetical protein